MGEITTRFRRVMSFIVIGVKRRGRGEDGMGGVLGAR
jgi:hypothetical protein